MGQFSTGETTHEIFRKKELTQEQKDGFARNDKIGSDIMYAFDNLPYNRESSLAKTKLEEAIFWANRSILMEE